ncbi:MAG: peptide-methionine (R)-S-oxide reductase MsrB [Dokdonella sp.]|uniref:peptide-methionine (R)-S-oxide reductase MsrB n=1 Tax=Dokdonella sp. TaxID=2291710 RepID=UPI0032650261
MSTGPHSDSKRQARRQWLLAAGAAAGGYAVLRFATSGTLVANAAPAESFEVSHSDETWRTLLTPQQYAILRQEGTERAFTSPLNEEKRRGVFACAGCSLDAFSSETKFESGTGWPSFWKPLPNAINQRSDRSLGMVRDEVHCRRCGGHFGHVFDDGPQPTGLRYCMNGLSLKFNPAS